MQLTPLTFLIVCPFLFLAGFIDSIGGGGGLISLPAYMIAGLPIHQAIATNKLSSTCGTTLATARFIRNGLVNFKLAVPSVICAILGSSIGAKLSLMMDESVMQKLLFIVLPATAFVVLNKKIFHDNDEKNVTLNRKTYLTASIAAFIVGIYDGFYGPGTGTFLIIAFTVFAHLSISTSNAQAKVINLTTNITALTVFLLNGQCYILLGAVGAVCNMAGNYLGSGMAMRGGSKVVKPVILFVLFLLFLKILGVY